MIQDISKTLTSTEARTQLWIVGIAGVTVFCYLLTLPLWLGGLLSTVSFSWCVWQGIAVYPTVRLHHLVRFSVNAIWFGVALLTFGFYFGSTSGSLRNPNFGLLANASLILYELYIVNFLLSVGDMYRLLHIKQPIQSSFPVTSSIQPIMFAPLLLPTSWLSMHPQELLSITFIGVIFLFLVALIALHVISSLLALRSRNIPTQPEVAA